MSADILALKDGRTLECVITGRAASLYSVRYHEPSFCSITSEFIPTDQIISVIDHPNNQELLQSWTDGIAAECPGFRARVQELQTEIADREKQKREQAILDRRFPPTQNNTANPNTARSDSLAETQPDPPTETPITLTIYITRTGIKYHRRSCPVLKKSLIKIPLPIADAQTRGYHPCKTCFPPQTIPDN